MRVFAAICIVAMAAAGTACTTLSLPEGPPPPVQVETPRVYNNVGLSLRLQQVRDRLARLYGLEQTKLNAGIGALQGAELRQTQGNLQVARLALPSNESTVSTSLPTGSNQVMTTENSGTGVTTAQTTTNSGAASGSTQTVAKSAAVTPAAPSLGSMTAMAAPTVFGQNALNTLEEQYQLEMELVTLQTLLEPPINAEYSADNNARRHVTLGFPLTIPAQATRLSADAAVEMMVTVCSHAGLNSGVGEDETLRPTLIQIIPKEKTYNTAAVTNKSMGGGLGVISGVFNVGGSFSWTRDTYYLVRAQDTVALGGDRSAEPLCGENNQGTPLRFGWLFKPVLGQKVVQAGTREAIAQLSLAGGDQPLKLIVSTRWLEFNTQTGTVGEERGRAPPVAFNNVKIAFDTLNLTDIGYRDERNGNGTVTLRGHFLPGTRVRLGLVEVPSLDAGHSAILFSASNQALATSAITMISPDGTQRNLDQTQFGLAEAVTVTQLKSRIQSGKVATMISADGQRYVDRSKFSLPAEGLLNRIRGSFDTVTGVIWPTGVVPTLYLVDKQLYTDGMAPFPADAQFQRGQRPPCNILANNPESPYPAQVDAISPTLVRVRLPLYRCTEIKPDGNYPLIAVIGNQAYGFPETAFSSSDDKEISFIAPRSLVESAKVVELGRLLLGNSYRDTYRLPVPAFRVDAIAISATSDQEVAYLIQGSQLDQGNIVSPAKAKVLRNSVYPGNTLQEIVLSASDATIVKKIVLQTKNDPPYVFDLPQPEKKTESKGADGKTAEGKKDGKSFTMSISGELKN